MQELENEFHEAMITTYEEGAKRGYYPTYFMQMLDQYGGVGTAKRLLAKREIQSGFAVDPIVKTRKRRFLSNSTSI